MMRTKFLAIGMVLASAGALAAQGSGTPLEFERDEGVTRAGTRGANFLEIGVGARAQALAGAYTALADGATALYWNTAATAEEEGFGAGYSHINLFEGSDISHDFVGVYLPTGFGTIGASLIYLSSGDMIRTTEQYPQGGDPEVGGAFDWTSTAVGLHFARRITDRLSIGVAGKVVNEGISGASATFYGADLSTVFDTGLYGVTIGASLSTLGTQARMEGQALRTRFSPGESEETFDDRRRRDIELLTTEVPLPTIFRLGLMTDLYGSSRALLGTSGDHNVRFMTDVSDAIDTDIQTRVALEYDFRDMVFLRGGKKWLNEARAEHRGDFGFGLSGGAGIAIPLGDERRLRLDYAYTGMADLENVQTFSAELSF